MLHIAGIDKKITKIALTHNIPYAIFTTKHIFQMIENLLFYIYSDYENGSFLKSMLLNHTQTIEKAGGRKTDVDEYNWDERLLNVDRSVFLFLQREEEWEKQK